MVQTPIIYLDTNIVRDWIKNRNEESIKIISTARDKKWKCVTSMLTFMELLDIEKEDIFFHKKVRQGWDMNSILRSRYNKNLSEEELKEAVEPISAFLVKEKVVTPLALDDDGWNFAMRISTSSTISSSDVIHLAVAYKSNADVLVTRDADFLEQGNNLLKNKGGWNSLRICKPKDVMLTLKKLGFKKLV